MNLDQAHGLLTNTTKEFRNPNFNVSSFFLFICFQILLWFLSWEFFKRVANVSLKICLEIRIWIKLCILTKISGVDFIYCSLVLLLILLCDVT